MAQIRNKFDIKNSIRNGNISECQKRLPNFFEAKDDIAPIACLSLSVASHIFFGVLLILLTLIQGVILPHLPKPELPKSDIEFKLVQNESKPPINKNTKIRSDRDSQAGGKHDPKKIVSEPSPAPSPAPAKKAAPAPKAPAKQPKAQPKVIAQQQPKVQPKQQVKPQPAPIQQPAKPKAAKAPSAAKPSIKPAIKPSGVSAPSAPKIAAAPKSPFTVSAPSSKAPVGSTYKPSGAPGGSYGKSSGSSGAPSAPKFSSSGGSASGRAGGSSGGSAGGKYGSKGSYGTGSQGNPSPGNPNGAPGIDAIRQPNWGPYMRDLEQRIKRNWTPPKGDSSKRVVITFTIGRDGRLLSHRITKSSGVPLADRAAMSAIELTAPFRPLPPEFKGQSVPIEFTFDYNVLNSVMR